MLFTRAATLKYFTEGSSGVAGLKTVLRYVEVRLEYAGESRRDRSSVVKEEGSDARDSPDKANFDVTLDAGFSEDS